MDQPTFNARMDEFDAANPVPAANAARRMTSLDIKIAAAKRRAEAEKATHAIPQAVPTQGLTSEFSTAGCNIANQRKPAHGGRVAIDAAASAGSADPAPVFVVGQGPAAETVAEVIEGAAVEVASKPPPGLVLRIALPPPGSKVAALGPGGLRFVVERSDKSVYLVMDGPDV